MRNFTGPSATPTLEGLLHRDGSRKWRLEVAMTGAVFHMTVVQRSIIFFPVTTDHVHCKHVSKKKTCRMSKNGKWKAFPYHIAGLSLLYLGLMMASSKAKAMGVPLRSLWLDSRSHGNLKDLCGATILALYGSDPVVCWHSLTERCLEKRFGRVRTSFPNSCMAAADYWRASAMVMRKETRKADENFVQPQEPEEKLSAHDFCGTAQRSWQAALKLAAMCSELSTAQLQSEFSNTNSGAICEAEMDCDEQSDEEGTGHQPVVVGTCCCWTSAW